jgi:hypothetical protein
MDQRGGRVAVPDQQTPEQVIAEPVELCSGERMLDDLHARYHCEPGNLLGKDDCEWDRCTFWDAAEHTVSVLRAAGLLLAPGQFPVSEQTWCRKHMFKKRRRGQSGSVEFFCERCERDAMRADPNHVHNFWIYYPGAFGQGVMACNCGEHEPKAEESDA